jgi:hypothetical protein
MFGGWKVCAIFMRAFDSRYAWHGKRSKRRKLVVARHAVKSLT